jgi:hypothetical protein
VADLGDAHRASFPDQEPEDAVADRGSADRRPLLIGDAARDEALDPRGVFAEYAQGSVPCRGQLDGELDDAAQHGVEVKLRGERESGLDQEATAVRVVVRRRPRVGHDQSVSLSVRPPSDRRAARGRRSEQRGSPRTPR